jgi:two-component sensor histidine kinase/ABC-type amino acid transport substrate-binding protein
MKNCFCFLLLVSSVFQVWSQKIDFTIAEKAWIKSHPSLIYGVTGEYAPYEFKKNNKQQGIVFEYVNYFEKATGIKCQSQFGNPLTGSNMTDMFAEKIDFIADLAITNERKEKVAFTQAFASEPLVIMSRMNDQYIGNLGDLKGKKVAIPNGYYTIEILKKDYPDLEIVEFKTVEDCLLALSTNKVDAVVEVLGVLAYYVNHRGFTNLRIVSPTEYRNIELAMATAPDNVILNGILNKVLGSISESDHGKIRHKWISVRYDAKPDNSELMKYLKWFAIGLGLILLLVLARNVMLKKHIQFRKESERKLNESLVQISQQNDERKILLKEIHHRVKNNLQLVSSLIKLQAAEDAENSNPFDVEQTISRIQTIGLIHEKIYKTHFDESVDSKDYFRSLIETIVQNYTKNKNIKTQIDIDAFQPKSQAMVPLAIIINELVVNSLKHAFNENQEGEITLWMKVNQMQLSLEYQDNGVWKEQVKTDSFGANLIEIFTEQLNGKMTLKHSPNTHYSFVFQADILE